MTSHRTTPEADEDLIALYIEGHDRFGRRQADRYFDEMQALFERLAAYPALARLRTEYDPPVRIHPWGAHVIVYQEDEDGVVILRVRQAQENWADDPAGDQP